ncbi:hypothetical protein CP061683_0891B, partial [Chlamydia psittaci 06-1683]
TRNTKKGIDKLHHFF